MNAKTTKRKHHSLSAKNMGSELINTIPTVDLSPFFQSGDNESGKGKAKEIITHACRTYGFFRIFSHGVPITLSSIDLSKTFFHRPYEDKLKSCPVPESNAPLPAGYMRQPEISGNKNEYVLVFKPELGFNVYLAEPTEFRSTLDECFSQMSRTALLVERILTECMGVPPNFIKDYDEARNTDFMVALRYFAVTMGDESSGLAEHQDGSCISFVFQDDVGGLVVLTDGKWISAEPSDDSIVVNIGDILQVLTNNTFISATHRVLRK
ncbi:gibberellin 2-beta-dioxygenase 7-like [Asparagus officinalis]|uniref:gibberellin 2-beta-dioxygenase 7-like n=1 Tax=Asparagus officinalis TaxID=4686 RepID=UPI00098DE64A|nr:gibberellin 2-beta-dioxygenase 7-like [Asparagus officinalis]